MSTLVCFHAHPDDEAIATGGTMLLAAQAGHRVVLVLATRGEHGEPVDGVLRAGEQLSERRSKESQASAQILGVHRVEFLGYEDSGMVGEPTNDDPASFWQADTHEAATRLAALLQEEKADVLTIYDPHGGYGHPDHIQVHRVGTEAAELVGVDRVYWATMNRTRIQQMMDDPGDLAETLDEIRAETAGAVDFGTPEDEITHAVDVSTVIAAKRRAMAAHESQISAEDFFLSMPEDAFAAAFGTEWYVAPHSRRDGDGFVTTLFE
ncbi:MAG: PIG-L family deacetylase [Acidimicrobiales bacterium]